MNLIIFYFVVRIDCVVIIIVVLSTSVWILTSCLFTSRIEVGGTLDVNTPGTYHLTYSYADGTNRGQTNLTVVVGEAGDAQ